jgi:hypothetical protein
MGGKNSNFEFDGRKYKTSDLTDVAKKVLTNLNRLNAVYAEKVNMHAVLTKAKKAYIADLKSEMLSAKSGFDFSE